MPPELSQTAHSLLATMPWSIVLPAGCGKTELIAAMAASVAPTNKPILVLTHTNAGVDVVRRRFTKYGVKPNQARVFTLDTWAKLFDDHFPLLGTVATLPAGEDLWLSVRLRAETILRSRHVGDILAATYSAIIVDEYQDCSDLQHQMVVTMGQYLPVGVLGDPLQGIFDFGPGVVDWTTVEADFAPTTLTATPHRWSVRNPNLGSWLLAIRPSLMAGGTIDLGAVGIPLTWQQSTPDLSGERGYCINAATAAGNTKQVVVLRQLPAQCHKFARTLIGKYDVAEEIECKVVGALAKAMDAGDGGKVAAATIKLVRDCCIGCPPPFNPTLMASYSQGNAKRYNSGNQYAAIYDTLNLLITQHTVANVKHALTTLKAASQRVFRWEAWRVAMQLLEELGYAGGNAAKQLQEVRNRTRYSTNTNNRNSISRTLLVKGQEYDECIILGADGMSARNLYVALSRGIDKVTVFSQQLVLTISDF